MRVIVADDGFIRDLLAKTFPSYGLTVTGQARTARELLDLVDADPPDIVIADIAMPSDAGQERAGPAGLDAARQIRRDHPEVAIVALSNHGNLTWVEEIIALGKPVGYQLKDQLRDLDVFVEIMRSVRDGEIRIDSSLVEGLFRRKRVDDPIKRLTPRERDVLRLIAEGRSNAAIAARLDVSKKAVETYETSVYSKLGLSRSRDAEERDVNVRVMAVLTWLRFGRDTGPP